jgi:hypothetical protein
MAFMSPQDREDRIKELEGFRDDWQKMIADNSRCLQRLTNLKIAGIDEYDQAILRATEAGEQLAVAKSNIEATIERVRVGGR